MNIKHIIKSLATTIVGLTLCTHTLADVQASEPELKAAIITNILLYIEWPTSNTNTEQLVVCYIEKNNVAEALIKLDGKTLKNKTLKVTQVTMNFDTCHAIYLTPSSIITQKTIDSVRTSAILIAGDSVDSLKNGIMLNLEIVNGKAVFDINLGLVKKVGLQISSKVLKLARKIIE